MREFKWEVSEKDTITLKYGWTGRKKLILNGQLLEKFARAKSQRHALSDGREVEVWTPNGMTSHVLELRVNGELMPMTIKGQERKCKSCGATARPYDKFCDECGGELPSAEHQQVDNSVKAASGGIGVLAILFLVSGLIMAGLQYNQSQDALQNLAQYDAQAQWSVPVNGKTVTVGELREMVLQEPIVTLLLNLLLAAIMTGLYFWGKRAPLPAILVATGTYLAVVVLNAIVDPASLGQGIFIKIIIVGLLYRGIRAGFQQRANAQ